MLLEKNSQKLREMNIHLKQTLGELTPIYPSCQPIEKGVVVLRFKLGPQPPPLAEPGVEIGLRERPGEDVAQSVVEFPLTCQFDREDKVAKSAHARKLRQEILREKRTHKRQRVQ
jgi:hypothetical protein